MMALKQAEAPSGLQDSLRGGYKKLNSDEEGDDQHHASQLRFQSRSHKTHHFHVLAVFILLITSSIFITIFFLNKGNHVEYHNLRPLSDSANPDISFSEWSNCGQTALEALDKGCVFDLMLSTWIHESCYDDEMMNRYLLEGNHTYFHDEDMVYEMPEEEARRGEYKTLWTDGEFHLRHCVYLMDMQLRSYKTGRPIEVSIYDFEHTQHCVNMTLWHDRDGKKTKIHALHGRCGFPKKR
ncbi:uncharacterized protein LY89DRAFT_753870 [Mollisia scopiformis]|uniref:Uncharacterized protein n=1 Tax=Mollisia scopiformis TaxID=149040 RepID=A0A194WZ93_MOLSC|nr:uncharacterized protein LY89DRAFT_753870 [Mollisia scopiformis]KUJ13265.1 hypothetical protein LY89DRAFT_753870 [Mollisia scopiformis]